MSKLRASGSTFFVTVTMLAVSALGCGGSSKKAPSDGGLDGGTCGTEGAACTLGSSQTKGLCHAGACAACTSSDDLACNTAYGSAGHAFSCQSGACAAGCNDGTVCAGLVCMAKSCTACSTNAQCQMSDPGSMCMTSTGVCVSAMCSTPGAACGSAGNLCCATVGGGNSCLTGNCCSNGDCTTSGQGCSNHVCTTCPAPSPSPGGTVVELYVDASEGASTSATGANLSGCRFRSITAAVASLGGSTAAHIHVAATQGLSTATGETFPIAILPNITVVGDATQSPTITVPSGRSGLMLGANSSLSNLTLAGMSAAGNGSYGVVVEPASASAASPPPSIDHVQAQGFSFCGIEVSNFGQLNVGSGVQGSMNEEAGLCLEKADVTAFVHVTNTSTMTADKVSFDGNGEGIFVDSGSLTVTGAGGASTVEVNNNQSSGLTVQTAPGMGSVSLNHVTVSLNTLDGLDVQTGSAVTVRGSTFAGNSRDGVHIEQSGSNTSNDGSTIDLGQNGSGAGGNLFQSNTGADICLDIPNGTTKTVSAAGNSFGTINCAATAGTLSHSAFCTGGINIGDIVQASPSPSPGPLTSQINVGQCTP